ncbi:hypothetical protein FSHL1_001231 [Fusarium sambucinum]
MLPRQDNSQSEPVELNRLRNEYSLLTDCENAEECDPRRREQNPWYPLFTNREWLDLQIQTMEEELDRCRSIEAAHETMVITMEALM